MTNKILVIDDEIAILEMMQLYLELEGFEVMLAYKGGSLNEFGN